jgi:hypothetical protein
MEKPGLYYKFVEPKSVSFAYKSLTYCKLQGLEFIVSKKENNKLLIEPYSADLYPTNKLIELDFENINTKLIKLVTIDNLESVWIKTLPLFDFKEYKEIKKSW